MPKRRRITSVVEQQHRLRELGRIRFGERKGEKRPGRPIEFPRISSTDRSVVEDIARVYGGEVRPWQRDDGAAPEWDVLTEGPLAVAVPPGIEAYTQALEQWAGGFLTVRCDGAMCQYRKGGRWVERACVCDSRGQDFKERPCKQTTRFTVMVLGVEKLGVFRVDTKSFFAGDEIPFTLAMLQQSGRAAWLQMRDRNDKAMVWDAKKGEDVPTTRRFKVIVLDAPFMPDEVIAITRPASMAALPAPTTPALGRGERPLLGAGASIDPVGPQVGDREPPPRPVDPVDIDEPPIDGEVMPADEEAADEAWGASAAEQESLLEPPAHADPVDAD